MRRGIQIESEPRTKRMVLNVTESMHRDLCELSRQTGMSNTSIIVKAFRAYEKRFKKGEKEQPNG